MEKPPDLGRHFFGHRARDNHQVGLTRRRPKNFATKASDVIARRCGRDHLYGATSKPELERPDRILASPVVKLLDRTYPDPLLLQFPAQVFVDSFAHCSARNALAVQLFIVPIANTLYSKPK